MFVQRSFRHDWLSCAGVIVISLIAGCQGAPVSSPPYQVVLDHLDDPRGLTLRADGTLCVAETGRAPESPSGADLPATVITDTGALACIDPAGQRQRLVAHLPYVLYSAGGITVGPSDVAELEGVLYVLTGEGYGELSRKLLRVETDGSLKVVADFLKFAAQGKPLAYFQPASIAANPCAMLPDPTNRRFLVTDGASGQVLAADVDGKISLYSPAEGYEVLTGIAWGPDRLPYVASFSQLPHEAGAGAIVRIQPDGSVDVAADKLTTPIDLAFDRTGRLYVLEFMAPAAGSPSGSAENPYQGRSGRLLRLARAGDGWGAPQVLIDNLPFPTAMFFGPDDDLYIVVQGAFSPPGSGQVRRYDGMTLMAHP